MQRNRLLRLLLGIIDTGRWLAPASRRRDWQRQWRADILHEWQWLTRHPKGVGDRAGLFMRAAGALRHAFWLRLHVRKLEMISQDIRYGWRLMVRRPAVTIVALLTLGLGIGANVSMFSWVDGRMRHLLGGVAEPDRLVALNGTTRTRTDLSLSYPDFEDFRRRRPDSVVDLIVYTLAPMNMRIDNGEPQRVFAQMVSGNYFEARACRRAARSSRRRARCPAAFRSPSSATSSGSAASAATRPSSADRSLSTACHSR
jgi:hypothetical protein